MHNVGSSGTHSGRSKKRDNHLEQLLPTLVSELQASSATRVLDFRGSSMQPFLIDGDRIHVVFGTPVHVEPGNIVLVRSDNTLFAHRILRVLDMDDGLMYEEAGDNSLVYRLVRSENIVGKVAAFYRGDHFFDLERSELKSLNGIIAGLQVRILTGIRKIPRFRGRDRIVNSLKYVVYKLILCNKLKPA